MDNCVGCGADTSYGGCCNSCSGTLCESCETFYSDDSGSPVSESCFELEDE